MVLIDLEPTHTYWCRSLVNREYHHWLQPVALTGYNRSKTASCWEESFTGGLHEQVWDVY
jgi:hypothetical protein